MAKAVKYIREHANEKIVISDKQIEDRREEIYKPLEVYEVGRNEIVGGTVSPSYILPIQGLQRLENSWMNTPAASRSIT